VANSLNRSISYGRRGGHCDWATGVDMPRDNVKKFNAAIIDLKKLMEP
jgi:hypothetical protein